MAKHMGRGRNLLKALVLLLLLTASRAESADTACRITVLGDSLTSGYGLPLEQAFPAQLEQALRQEGFACTVLNAGVSGDTSAGGLARLDWVLADQPTHVIVELGGNDGLRGLPPEAMERNLDAIIERLEAEQIEVLLAGMLAPPNLGRAYGEEFKAVFPRVAERHDIPLYPFFLENVAAEPEVNLPDGIHPSAQGIARIVEGISPTVKAWLNGTGVPGS